MNPPQMLSSAARITFSEDSIPDNRGGSFSAECVLVGRGGLRLASSSAKLRSGSIEATFSGIEQAGPYTTFCNVTDGDIRNDEQALKEYTSLNESITVVDTGSIEVVNITYFGSYGFKLSLSRELSRFEIPGTNNIDDAKPIIITVTHNLRVGAMEGGLNLNSLSYFGL